MDVICIHVVCHDMYIRPQLIWILTDAFIVYRYPKPPKVHLETHYMNHTLLFLLLPIKIPCNHVLMIKRRLLVTLFKIHFDHC